MRSSGEQLELLVSQLRQRSPMVRLIGGANKKDVDVSGRVAALPDSMTVTCGERTVVLDLRGAKALRKTRLFSEELQKVIWELTLANGDVFLLEELGEP